MSFHLLISFFQNYYESNFTNCHYITMSLSDFTCHKFTGDKSKELINTRNLLQLCNLYVKIIPRSIWFTIYAKLTASS